MLPNAIRIVKRGAQTDTPATSSASPVCAIKYVSARAQADIARRLEDVLTEEEKEVMRRGRSSKTAHRAKNATLSDYHLATGFEALCGYLYLAGKTDRLLELIKMSREGEDEEEI